MSKNNKKTSKLFGEILLLAGILLLGAYLRFNGINWDENFHLHPDERFLTMVETSLVPVGSIGEYFNTATSSLNPHNILDANGNSTFPFFVYGTLPIILVRYFAHWLGMTGYNEVHLVGRCLSGIFDLGTVLIVFLIAWELFQKKWLSYLAALFYTCAILPIQISHFFIVDNFATFFSALALLFAVRIQMFEEQDVAVNPIREPLIADWKGFKNFAFFGIALGLAAASKINTIVLAALLPIAVLLKDGRLLHDLTSCKWKIRVRDLVLAGVISFIVFRIFQPYAFTGPGFFGILPNAKWMANLSELSFISSGESNYPPSIQWARRSFWFPVKNLIIWGLGLPVGILAVAGLLFMAYKLITGQEKRFALLWFFGFFYLVWQALRWNPTMRYFLIIYPVLAILASWLIGQAISAIEQIKKPRLAQIGIGLLLTLFVNTAALGSLSFLNIYRQPMTRIAASEWIYRNIPGAVNLVMADPENDFIQPLPYPNFTRMDSGKSIAFIFSPEINGQITSIRFDHIVNPELTDSESSINLFISSISSEEVLFSRTIQNTFNRIGDSRGEPLDVILDTPLNVNKDNQYQFILTNSSLEGSLQFFGNIDLEFSSDELNFYQPVFEFTRILSPEDLYESIFSPIEDSPMKGIKIFRWLSLGYQYPVDVSVEITDSNSGNQILSKKFSISRQGSLDYRGSPIFLEFEDPIPLKKEENYSLQIRLLNENAKVAINGSKALRETDWDDGLPLYMYGYNPFDSYEGIYASDLNLQIYWDDDQSKLQRFLDGLYQADYFIITSSRQWGSVTQIPERYPLTTFFYRNLIGCQAGDVQWCYRVAEPDKFDGKLGFDLQQTFQVNPAIFGWQFNSQFAEEAFTVYDHPKVLIFEKSSDFNFSSIFDQLTSVNLDQVLNISIKESEQRPGLLALGPSRWNEQRESGTWSGLFDYQSLLNSNQFLGTIVWYLFVTLLGWICYPLVRSVFSGLTDKGFPLAKLTGLVLWAWLSWLGGSIGIPFTRISILISLLLVASINLAILVKNRNILIAEFKEKWRYFATVELISLGLFLFFVLIRLGNPDLWHPYKGGEKPMDFAYLNAVIKSVKFPPYDPWYAGGYINYYYYGFLLAGIIVKLLGIIPSIAYNLILPTFFSFTGMAAFSLGWNLIKIRESIRTEKSKLSSENAYVWGIIAVILVLIIGNLGTISMFFQGIFTLGMSGAQGVGFGLIDKLVYFFRGLAIFFQGANFSFYPGDWYWIPSRAIPGNVITEFPFFTFLYGDPHAHLFAYPLTLVILGWCLSVILGRLKNDGIVGLAWTIFTGALLIGTLRTTNTWDYPVYLVLGCISLVYVSLRYGQSPAKFLPGVNLQRKNILYSALLVVFLITLSLLLFAPFDRWYGQAYTSIDIWRGEKTPLWAYFIHWGFFLFIEISWLFYKIWIWMKHTPLATLEPYYRRRKLIFLTLLGLAFIITAFLIYGVQISVVVLPLISVLLIFLVFDRTADDRRKFVIFLLLTGIGLTMMVELINLSGDIGRMNTVFKFYLQAWTFISIAVVYLLADLLTGTPGEKRLIEFGGWKIWFGLFSFSVLLFPLMASMDKIQDRMNDLTPITLDGMDYMKYSSYEENGVLMALSQDYYAIRWMQENVSGTPVIAEANVPEYRWGNRFSIYTGLPSVVGWNWHQRQQRAINPGEWIFKRVEEVTDFYSTTDIQSAVDFISQYDVEYIILGQLERAIYPSEGLMKFEEFSGKLWDVVYEAADTRIYKVKG
jgi:YYY domain-containing protein